MIKWHPQRLFSLHFCSLLQWQRLSNQIMSFWSNSRPQRCKMKNTLSFDPTSKPCRCVCYTSLFWTDFVWFDSKEFVNRFTCLLPDYWILMLRKCFDIFLNILNGIFIFREDMMWHVGSDTSPHVHRSQTHLTGMSTKTVLNRKQSIEKIYTLRSWSYQYSVNRWEMKN